MTARKPAAKPAADIEHIDQFPIEQVTVDKGLQARVNLNNDAIGDYKDVIFSGGTLPPVELIKDGDTYYLWDGFHRHAAYQRLGIMTIPVNIRKGTRQDAILASVGANQTHGIRRTNADKRRAVDMVFNLMDSVKENWTDQRIAELTGVSAMFVGNVRKEKYPETYEKPRTTATGATVTRTATAVAEETETPEAEEATETATNGKGLRVVKPAETKPGNGPKVDTKYPLGLAVDKLRNRLLAAEQGLGEVEAIFPDTESLGKALSAAPALVQTWQALREQADTIADAMADIADAIGYEVKPAPEAEAEAEAPEATEAEAPAPAGK